MPFPKVDLSVDPTLKTYASNGDSVLQIKSMLFNDAIVEFLGFMTDMSQTFDSTWNTEQVFGRNDPIAIFQGTKRTVSITFQAVAGTVLEAQNNLTKIDQLAQFLYPSYKRVPGPTNQSLQGVYSSSYMSGAPLVKVKFSNLINSSVSGLNDGLMGYIDSLSINPVLDAGTFVSGGHFPKVFEISFGLNVLHQATPGWDANGGWLGQQGFFGSATETAKAQSGEPPAETTATNTGIPITERLKNIGANEQAAWNKGLGRSQSRSESTPVIDESGNSFIDLSPQQGGQGPLIDGSE